MVLAFILLAIYCGINMAIMAIAIYLFITTRRDVAKLREGERYLIEAINSVQKAIVIMQNRSIDK